MGPQLHPLSLCLCPKGQADAEDTEGKHPPLSPRCAEPRPRLRLFPRHFPAPFPPGCCSGTPPCCCRPPCRGARVIPGLPHLPHTPGLSRCHSRAASVGGGSCWEGLLGLGCFFFFSWLFNCSPWKTSRGKFRRLAGFCACLRGMEQPSLVLCTGGRAGRGCSSGFFWSFHALPIVE